MSDSANLAVPGNNVRGNAAPAGARYLARVSFFDPPQLPPRPEPARQPWRGDDSDTVGAPVGIVEVVARNEDAAALVSGLVAFPSGFSLSVLTITRRGEAGPRHGPFGDDASEMFRFGIRFADGSKVTDFGDRFPPRFRSAGGPWLQQRGGGGGGRKYSQAYWCQPLPPSGPMTFVCEWVRYGIPQTEREIDAGIILSAVERAYPLWPDDVGLEEPHGYPGVGPNPGGFTSSAVSLASAEATEDNHDVKE